MPSCERRGGEEEEEESEGEGSSWIRSDPFFSGLERWRCLRIIDIHAAVEYVSPCLLSDRADIHFTVHWS